jgi:molecular chaperone DnaJ
MPDSSSYYQTLDVEPNATQVEIKKAYRQMAKRFHPDVNQDTATHDKITRINQAYEVLGDPQSRRSYDHQLQYQSDLDADGFAGESASDRQKRTAATQEVYRQQRQAEQDVDSQLRLWLNRVFTPVNRQLNLILRPLKAQMKDLSADPFDDQLMEAFQAYIEDCHQALSKAQIVFRSLPNPVIAAGAAANLYHCLNQVSDGIEELEYFTNNYDDSHLHTGQELFRIAERLRRDVLADVRELR